MRVLNQSTVVIIHRNDGKSRLFHVVSVRCLWMIENFDHTISLSQVWPVNLSCRLVLVLHIHWAACNIECRVMSILHLILLLKVHIVIVILIVLVLILRRWISRWIRWCLWLFLVSIWSSNHELTFLLDLPIDVHKVRGELCEVIFLVWIL